KPTRHRIKAGMIAVILAEKRSMPELAHEAFAALSPLLSDPSVADDLNTLSLLLIYHSVFGDIDTSERLAHQMLQTAEQLEPGAAAHVQRKAGVALLR